uniref:Uncharacterized protein n=1 Tax=Knipowitschia caucasica TaxID=637954 RepID=A0AAV2LCW4_KNICA
MCPLTVMMMMMMMMMGMVFLNCTYLVGPHALESANEEPARTPAGSGPRAYHFSHSLQTHNGPGATAFSESSLRQRQVLSQSSDSAQSSVSAQSSDSAQSFL